MNPVFDPASYPAFYDDGACQAPAILDPPNLDRLRALLPTRSGRVPVNQVASVVQPHPIHARLAQTGAAWLYATPILHASEAAVAPTRRRALQIDYAAFTLPGGLEWLGIGL